MRRSRSQALAAIGPLAWTRLLLLHGELANAQLKKLRCFRRPPHPRQPTPPPADLRYLALEKRNSSATFHRLAALPRPAS
ncbi:hypothetical protein ACGFYU_37490 [Streptomyces sp. NPDC048337]|uniref:hypothetical protein n=1 Tax=Streptomyces sp. NPDC048337 TaxID=3365535 RepID=UPI0037138B28